jgi:archaemetzincin
VPTASTPPAPAGTAAPGAPGAAPRRSPGPRPRRPLPKDYKLRLTALGVCAVLLIANIVVGFFVLTARRRGPAPAEAPAAPLAPVPPSAMEGGGYADMSRLPELRAVMEKLRPLHQKIHAAGPMDWLANHKEPGQTFAEYVRCEPVTLSAGRKTIYIQPLGEFTATQRKIVLLAGEYLARYFNAEISVTEDLPLDVVPASARRAARGFGPQINASSVLRDVLVPRLPKDAAAYIAFTATDLYPEDSWNFCFGQASLRERVGVWSLARYGDPESSLETFRLCLLRTLKVATHETGHMFSMYH